MSSPSVSKIAITEWLSTETGLRVIESNSNRPGAGERYISVNFKRYSNREGGIEDERIRTGDDGSDALTTVVHRREKGASIQAHGEGCMEALEDARDALELQSKREQYFGSRNITVDCGPVRNIPERQNGQWKNRAHMDITYHTTDTSIDRAPLLESAETAIGPDSDFETIIIEGEFPS